jgi:AAA family ATP:ADP antiporter
MIATLRALFTFEISPEKHDRLKLLFLSIIFFVAIAGYTVIRALKDSLFVSIVGREYWGWAKMWSILILIPAILLYSKVVDLLRRYEVAMVYGIIYGIGGLTIAYFIADPVIGLPNTVASGDRAFGWIIYFFLEGLNPFLISVLWSFSHSITRPEEARTNYPLMVAASKIGGIVATAGACWLLAWQSDSGSLVFSDVVNHQILITISSFFLLMIPLLLHWFIKAVPGRFLHGYEAAYKVEKQRSEHETTGIIASLKSAFSGLWLLIRYPYTLGIFGVIFFWEIVSVFLNYERIGVAQKAAAHNMSMQSCIMLNQEFWAHVVGLGITLIGTRTLLNLLGERKSLILVPLIVGALIVLHLSVESVSILTFVFVLTRSLNYAFAQPLRESLYIPTTKEIKFKTKSWIDAFGVKVAKGVGGGYATMMAQLVGVSESLAFIGGMSFFLLIIGCWLVTAHLLGRRFERAVKHNEVIGA